MENQVSSRPKIRCHQDLKYKEFVIRDEINDSLGHHKSWYQKFNALSQHQRKKWKDLPVNSTDSEPVVCLNTPGPEVTTPTKEKTERNSRSLRSTGSSIKTTKTGIFMKDASSAVLESRLSMVSGKNWYRF